MQSKFAIDFIYIEKQYDLSGYPGDLILIWSQNMQKNFYYQRKKTNSQHEVIKTRFEPGTF